MGRHKSLIFALLGPLLLAACMSPTYYAPASDGEGYTDQQIADGRYRISFAGNSITSRNVVDNYMLYRAAEITLASGNDYFVLLDHDVERDVTYRSYVDVPPGPYFDGPYFYGPYFWPDPLWHRHGFFYGYDPYYDPYYDGFAEVTSQPIEKYRAYATIAVHSGERPKDDANAYDARDVVKRLGGTVLRPPP